MKKTKISDIGSMTKRQSSTLNRQTYLWTKHPSDCTINNMAIQRPIKIQMDYYGNAYLKAVIMRLVCNKQRSIVAE